MIDSLIAEQQHCRNGRKNQDDYCTRPCRRCQRCIRWRDAKKEGQ